MFMLYIIMLYVVHVIYYYILYYEGGAAVHARLRRYLIDGERRVIIQYNVMISICIYIYI